MGEVSAQTSPAVMTISRHLLSGIEPGRRDLQPARTGPDPASEMLVDGPHVPPAPHVDRCVVARRYEGRPFRASRRAVIFRATIPQQVDGVHEVEPPAE